MGPIVMAGAPQDVTAGHGGTVGHSVLRTAGQTAPWDGTTVMWDDTVGQHRGTT